MVPYKDFQDVLVRYLLGENIKGDTDIYIQLEPEDRKTIEDIKKALAKIKYRLNKNGKINRTTK